ncbi:hypothetical protein DL98DRAFT_495122 [Cadophora sp. DSE1049]|nr:hypothetical protein DL98DRAFT_495122 [Cadophora sp. DSE1049]
MRRHELVDEASRILWRGYWKRVWIFQEIVVSENPIVQCGSVRVSWEAFCQAVIALLEEESVFGGGYGNAAKERLEAVYWERRAWRRKRGLRNEKSRWNMGGLEEKGRMGLLDLLVTKRGSEASDARDMVFAISGVASVPVKERQLKITYEKSPAGVYMDTVKYLIDEGSYEILSHAGLHPSTTSRSSKHQIPSWAPDWRRPSPYKTKIVDWIATSPSSHLLRNNHIYLPHHNSLICLGHQSKSHTIQSISADTSEVKPAAGSIGRVIWDDKWRRRKLIEHGVSSDLGTRLGSVEGLVSRSHPLTYGRKLARLRGDVLALVPREAREEDVVVVFRGGKVPFVLRRLERGQCDDDGRDELEEESLRAFDEMSGKRQDLEIGHFQFIGECFVDGLMRFDSHEKHNEKIQAFALH